MPQIYNSLNVMKNQNLSSLKCYSTIFELRETIAINRKKKNVQRKINVVQHVCSQTPNLIRNNAVPILGRSLN